MTAFFFCFKDQSELGEGYKMYYWKVEVSTRQDYQVLHLNFSEAATRGVILV